MESNGVRYASEWLLESHGPGDDRRHGVHRRAGRGVGKLLAKVLGGPAALTVRKAVARDLDDIAAAVE